MVTTSYGRYALVNKQGIRYGDARVSCAKSGGYLAALETNAEFDALVTFNTIYFIGFNGFYDPGKWSITINYISSEEFYLTKMSWGDHDVLTATSHEYFNATSF